SLALLLRAQAAGKLRTVGAGEIAFSVQRSAFGVRRSAFGVRQMLSQIQEQNTGSLRLSSGQAFDSGFPRWKSRGSLPPLRIIPSSSAICADVLEFECVTHVSILV